MFLYKCEIFGYADNFKLVATNRENKQYDIKQVEEWYLNNKMTLNENKYYILPIKSQEKFKLSLNNKTLLFQSEQKDLGITMAPKLNWTPNVKKRCSKALKLFYFLKRNTSTSTKLSAKINAYAGYVVPIVANATQAWFANKMETKEIERVQKKATSWILNNWELNYKTRLGNLNLLLLSLYLELNNLLLLIAFFSGNYEINIPINRNQNFDDQPNTRQFELININQTRTKKQIKISGGVLVNF